MRSGTGRLVGMLAGLVAPAALAQDPPPAADPIGEVLEQAAPTLPEPYAARPRRPSQPVHVDDTGKSPEAPPSVSDLAYDSRIRASMASAQGFQGPLDGGWTLATDEGDRYAFQLVDRSSGVLEGAWRDVRRPGALTASGLVDRIERTGGDVILSFGGRTATLRPAPDGRWTGELDEGGTRRSVSLRRASRP